MSAMNDYLENKLIDFVFRGQTFVPPTTVYVSLFTANPSDVGGGTEVTGGAYARVAIACTLANFAGTQGAGTVVASSGVSGTTSNNAVATFPTPTAAWGTVTGVAFMDAATGGNMLFYGALTASQAVATGNTVSFAASQLTVQIDN